MKKIIFLFFFLMLLSCKKEINETAVRSGIENLESIEIKDKDIDNFWNLYSKLEKQMLESFDNGDKYQNKYISDLDGELKKIDPSLSIEIKPNTKENRVLIITANGIPELFPAVIKIAKKAPENRLWKIEALKQRVELPVIIDYMGTVLDSKTVEFSYDEREDGRIDIEIFYPENTKDNLHMTYIFLDGIIGEYDTSKYIGSIDLTDKKSDGKKYQSLEEIRKILDEKKLK